MKNWRLAESLVGLRAQLDERFQNRDRKSDGSIGDASHSARKSDHNAQIQDGNRWVVAALDVDRDIAPGVTSRLLAEALIASRDTRIAYIISTGEICSGAGFSKPAWKWRPYTGVNAHKEHMHLSVKNTKRFYDDEGPWRLDLDAAAQPAVPPEPAKRPTLRLGSAGSDVAVLQRLLGGLKVDADFGPKTAAAVEAYQRANGLKPDRVVGPVTWGKLTGASNG